MAADEARQRRPRTHSPSPRENGKRKGSGAAKHPGMAWARRIGSAGEFWPIRAGERGSHVQRCPPPPLRPRPDVAPRRDGGFCSAALWLAGHPGRTRLSEGGQRP
ncbi:Slit-Robo Rho Gtpase-Activating Protein 2 [Manis pentadactyla]|nr:Slit-Robo Rho Gtpase-Activating Protein 2 [Manis pentadactyla]